MRSAAEALEDAKLRGNCLEPYFVANYEAIIAEIGRARRKWKYVLRAVEDLGLVDERGGKPSKQTVSRTWKRVAKMVEARRQASTPGVRAAPVWQPIGVDDPVRPNALSSRSPDDGSSQNRHRAGPDAADAIAACRKKIAEAQRIADLDAKPFGTWHPK